jgi:hypothetical protein
MITVYTLILLLLHLRLNSQAAGAHCCYEIALQYLEPPTQQESADTGATLAVQLYLHAPLHMLITSSTSRWVRPPLIACKAAAPSVQQKAPMLPLPSTHEALLPLLL